jgi:hypothetical protein
MISLAIGITYGRINQSPYLRISYLRHLVTTVTALSLRVFQFFYPFTAFLQPLQAFIVF